MQVVLYIALTILVVVCVVIVKKRMQGIDKNYTWQRCTILVVIGGLLMGNGWGAHWFTDIKFLAGITCIISSIAVGYRKRIISIIVEKLRNVL